MDSSKGRANLGRVRATRLRQAVVSSVGLGGTFNVAVRMEWTGVIVVYSLHHTRYTNKHSGRVVWSAWAANGTNLGGQPYGAEGINDHGWVGGQTLG